MCTLYFLLFAFLSLVFTKWGIRLPTDMNQWHETVMKVANRQEQRKHF